MLTENIKVGLDRYMDVRDSKETCSQVFNQLNYILNQFIEIVEKEPLQKWGIMFAKKIIEIKSIEKLDNQIKDFLNDYLPFIWDALRKPIDNKCPIPRIAIDNIMMIKEHLPCPEYIPQEIMIIPLEELQGAISNSRIINIIPENDDGITLFNFEYKNHHLSIPLLDSIYHKGGVARLVAKLFFQCKEHLINSELPINDFDLMTYNLEDAKKIMQCLGEKDLSGIELFHDLKYAFSSRDVSMNLTLLTKKGLIYSPEARKSIEQGSIYHLYADHGIYSKNYFYYNGHYFIHDRGFERLMKFLIDGKTDSIEISNENLQIFMKGYPLVLFGRYLEKANRAMSIQKIYYLLDKLGQLDMYRYCFNKFGVDFKNLFNFFEVLHHFYPAFSIVRCSGDEFTARWLTKKLLTWLKREFKKRYKIQLSNFDWIILDQEKTTRSFDLKHFVPDPELTNKIELWIPEFIQRCEKRNRFSS